MRIREKLMVNFWLYVTLAIILGVFAYIELRTITKKSALVEIADDITNTFLEIRRYEKNFLLFKDTDSLNELRKYLAELNKNIDGIRLEIIKEIGPDDFHRMKKTIAEYESLVNKVAESPTSQDLIDNMRIAAQDIEVYTKGLSEMERTNIDLVLKRSIYLLVFAIATIIILGTIVNIKLARSIAIPIKNLEEATKKVATGDFSRNIEVHGKDEIASLAVSFNEMEVRLRDTMNSLELAIKNLHNKQKQLVETEKLATLGKFSAGVAHEINNPLAIINEKAGLIKDYIDMSDDFPNKEKFLSLLNSIFDSVNRCSAITHRILGFARKADFTIEPIDINDIVRDVLGFLEREILYKSIRIETILRENLPMFNSDRIQLEQIFLNLIKNAIDAVEIGGLILISTNIKDGNMVTASVKDNGHGIPEEMLKNIFEPFFTTKEKGKGTGLGLSITHGIIKRLGGNIFVESSLNEGTTFTVEIPVEVEQA